MIKNNIKQLQMIYSNRLSRSPCSAAGLDGVSGTSSGSVLRVFGGPVSSVHHIVHQLGLQF